jgi:hypothetical protein
VRTVDSVYAFSNIPGRFTARHGMTATVSSIAAIRIDGGVALFIAHLVLAAFYHRKVLFTAEGEPDSSRGEKANFGVGLNCTTPRPNRTGSSRRRIQFNYRAKVLGERRSPSCPSQRNG